MKLTMLGTGHAGVMNIYNTCFLLEDEGQYFMVDAGGGNRLLSQVKQVNVSLMDVHDIFVTHRHLDHITGILWVLRMYFQRAMRDENMPSLRIYGHNEVIEILDTSARLLFPKEAVWINKKIFFIEVKDNETITIVDHPVTFFDIHSTKAKQFGFVMDTPKGRIACCGDEPCHKENRSMIHNSTWLLHEAFCLYEEKDLYHPYEKDHSTVRDACVLAEEENIPHLVLYHTEEDHGERRKELYLKEGREYYHGDLHVPEDLEVIEL